MKPIEHEKLVDILTKKGFKVEDSGKEVFVIFYPPSVEEARGEEEESISQRYYIIKFKIVNGLAYYENTVLMEGDRGLRVLSEEEVEFWLENVLGE